MKAKPYCIGLMMFIFLALTASGVDAQLIIWANDGGDKVIQDDLRAAADTSAVYNHVWDGQKISLFGGRNEVISFNLILEAPTLRAGGVTVQFDRLNGPDGAVIASKAAAGDGVFTWVGRNIELFFVRYLQIKGLSELTYNSDYDERHIPERFRRPWVGEGDATGAWENRPDHDKFYPDIAVPLELETPFNIAAGANQSIWADIYIPKTAAVGLYQGILTVAHDQGAEQQIQVELIVRNFSLPDYPSAPTMLYYSDYNIRNRYLGVDWVDPNSADYQKLTDIIDLHFLLAHRHKISLIDESVSLAQMAKDWPDRLDGDLFTAARGYDGPGVAVGNNVYSIGTYGAWTYAWSDTSEAEMWSHTDAWVNWFESQAFATPTEYFLYLIDESDDYEQTERWAQWMDNNPGPGKRLMSMATISQPDAWENKTPSLDIPTCGLDVGITDLWENATRRLAEDPDKRFYFYNGTRPASGSFCIEDDGVALRLNGWIQHKKRIDRWFYWESTYYDNYQCGLGETDVFSRAQTYGCFDRVDTVIGETGWNYTNGDGVLFYPGTDIEYPGSSHGVMGPFASLRLKHWRRGIQDADYLALASTIDAAATTAIVERMLPKVLWEYGVENKEDPTYLYTDISWSTDPDLWETARQELADIIESDAPTPRQPAPEIKANESDGPVTIADGDSLTISIGLNAGDCTGTEAIWWILAVRPDGPIYYYDLYQGKLVEGVLPIYEGALFDFPEIPVLQLTGLSPGGHTYYFGLYINDGPAMPSGNWFYDFVAVNVTGQF